MSLNLYHYKAEVLSVYDGDTVTLMIDQGMKHFARVKVRMVGINTPEIRTKDLDEKARGYEAKEYLNLASRVKRLSYTPLKKVSLVGGSVSYGLMKRHGRTGESLNDEMIRMGHAVAYNGGKR